MKKLMQFIKGSNQVILLIVLLFIVYDFLDTKFNPYDFTPREPELRVVSDESELEKIPLEEQNYRLEYGKRTGGAHIFEVRRKFVAWGGVGSRAGGVSARKLSISTDQDEIVNILFVHEDGSVTKVFEHDVFITDLEVRAGWHPPDSEPLKLRCVYAVIMEDTNGDGVLSSKDRVDLYSTDDKGGDLQLVVENIDEFHRVDRYMDSDVIITRNEGASKTFWIYRLKDGSIEEINLKNSPNQTGGGTSG